MAEGLNRVTLIGNLGTEPELAYTQNNQPVLKFRMATNESFQTKAGERQQRTEWHNVVVWGKRGEALHKILNKGSHICVEGSIRSREWEGRDGQKRWSTDIIAQNIVLLGGRREGASAGAGAAGMTRSDAAGTPPPSPSDDEPPAGGGGGIEGDEDIPF